MNGKDDIILENYATVTRMLINQGDEKTPLQLAKEKDYEPLINVFTDAKEPSRIFNK